MVLDKEDKKYLSRAIFRLPFTALAKKYGFGDDLVAFSVLLRKEDLIEDATPYEILYINENKDIIPHNVIADNLGMKHGQVNQIIRRTLNTKTTCDMTLDLCILKTKWLLESKLNLDIDDNLPRLITGQKFADHGLWSCLDFATANKDLEDEFKGWTSAAYLVCKTYPNTFKPFQFKGSKACPFTDKTSAKHNLIMALDWVVREKLGYKTDDILTLRNSKYFITDKDLRFYGVAPIYFLREFGSKEEFISSWLNKIVPNNNSTYSNSISTSSLRKILVENNVPISTCQCCRKDYSICDIHHIIPKSLCDSTGTDTNNITNLVVLCPNHHREAHTFTKNNLQSILELPAEKRLQYLIENIT